MNKDILKCNEIIDEIKSLISTKSSDYGDPWVVIENVFSHVGGYKSLNLDVTQLLTISRLLEKIVRYLNLSKVDASTNYESVRDSLIDIAGYSVGLIKMHDESMNYSVSERPSYITVTLDRSGSK